MSDDLMKQAELRHQRRPRSTQNEEITLLDKHTIKTHSMTATSGNMDSKQSLPPIRHHGNADKNISSLMQVGQLKPEDKPRTPRRRITSHNNSDLLGMAGDVPTKKVFLPFINCKINNKDVKALINTSAQSSTINTRVHDINNISKTPSSVSLTIDDNIYKMQLTADDVGIHDLVLGMDFISDNKCVLDFGRKSLSINGSTSVAFLTEEVLPLKFRSIPGLAASM